MINHWMLLGFGHPLWIFITACDWSNRIALPRRPARQRDIHIHHPWCPGELTDFHDRRWLRSSQVHLCVELRRFFEAHGWFVCFKHDQTSVDSWKLEAFRISGFYSIDDCWWFLYVQPQVSFYIQSSTNPSMFNKPHRKLRPLSQCWQVLIQRTRWANLIDLAIPTMVATFWLVS